MKQATLRISNPSGGNIEDVISIQIGCKSSRHEIITIEIAFKDFTKALMSREVDADIDYLISSALFENIGKQKEVLRVTITKPDNWGYKPTLKQIEDYLLEHKYLPEWVLWQDGLDTQQNSKGVHNVVLCKYVDAITKLMEGE